VRWVRYSGFYSGADLLGACLASYEMLDGSTVTSCNGGLSGLGETGDARVPKLIGVGCVDMNLVVDLPTLEAHPGYSDFWSLVQSDMTQCTRITLTEDQMEALRGEVGASSMCGTSAAAAAAAAEDEEKGEDDDDAGAAIGAVVAIVLIGGGIVAGICVYKKTCGKAKEAPPAATPAPTVSATAQPGAAYGAAVPQAAAQPTVVMAGTQMTQPMAVAQGVVVGMPNQPAAIPMGQVMA
jgi:hypothetical protein